MGSSLRIGLFGTFLTVFLSRNTLKVRPFVILSVVIYMVHFFTRTTLHFTSCTCSHLIFVFVQCYLWTVERNLDADLDYIEAEAQKEAHQEQLKNKVSGFSAANTNLFLWRGMSLFDNSKTLKKSFSSDLIIFLHLVSLYDFPISTFHSN